MESNNILFVCGAALIAIFIVLPTLALIMDIIVRLFPYKAVQLKTNKSAGTEPAIRSAIEMAYANTYPGTKVIKIVEQK